VVAVTEIPSIASHPSNSPYPGLTRIGEMRKWVLNNWEHPELVHPNTGIAGHSFGALHGARFAQGKYERMTGLMGVRGIDGRRDLLFTR
jgi:hypothetical protein